MVCETALRGLAHHTYPDNKPSSQATEAKRGCETEDGQR